MAGKRPTRPQLRARRRALNSYLVSTESSYADLAAHFGVKESTVRKFLEQDTKSVRTRYNSTPGFQKLYNSAAKNSHTSDLRKLAKSRGDRFTQIPALRYASTYGPNKPVTGYTPGRVKQLRREIATTPRAERKRIPELGRRAGRLMEYTRNVERDYVERDYWSYVKPKERAALDFQKVSFNKHRPRGLYDFLDSGPSEEEIEEYADDVIEIYHLNDEQAAGFSARIQRYLNS